MSGSLWCSFLLVSLATAFSPGQAVLLAITNSLAYGIPRALLGALGNAGGIVVLAGLASAGAGTLLRGSPAAYALLQGAGGLYLVYLGIAPWLAGRASMPVPSADVAAPSRAAIVARSFTVALTNPKGILFFTALFPQFVQNGSDMAGRFLVLTLTFAGCTVLSHAVFVACAWHARHWIGGGRLHLFKRGMGAVFIVLGIWLLLRYEALPMAA